jgi:hypothetical protein
MKLLSLNPNRLATVFANQKKMVTRELQSRTERAEKRTSFLESSRALHP